MTNRFLLLLAIFVMLSGSAPSGPPSPPNILLIVADDLGYSDLGCYGGEIETPVLDALAADGLRLTRFYNTGRCCPSRAAVLTGHYPHRVGLGHMTQDLDRPGYRGRLSPDAVTIAQLLQPAGYRSFIAGKWHLGTPDPTAHGFEEFYGTLVSAKTFWDQDHFLRLPAGRRCRSYEAEEFYATDATTDHALDFLRLAERSPATPWFLYLAYNAPHFPLQAKQTDIAKYANRYAVGWDEIRRQRLQRMKERGLVSPSTVLTPRSAYVDYGHAHEGVNPAWDQVAADRQSDLARRMAIYAAMVDSMDQNVGRVVKHLRSTEQLANTLIIFLSDNGACAEWDPWGFDISSSPNNILHSADQLDQMGRPGTFHSAGSGWANASNTPWRLYKHFNHEGGINSPCIIHWSDGIQRAGQIDATPTHLIDWMPTIADVAAARYQGSHPLPGTSLVPLFSTASLASRALFFEHEGNRAVIDGRWKLVAQRDRAWELYDTEVDRTELTDLADALPEQVAKLSQAWDRWAASNDVTPLPDDYQVPYLSHVKP